MFSKISRYRRLSDVTSPDAKGRLLPSRDLRLLPETVGTFRHTVNSGDRLDQLAYKYYGEPLLWWNIADANADFLSPLALIDRDPVVMTRFPVTATGTPPWAEVFAALLSVVGVESVKIEDEIALFAEPATLNGEPGTLYKETFVRGVVVTYNRQKVAASDLANHIKDAGFEVLPFSDLGNVGQEIIIPPRPSG
jgi:hypothetical protein